MKTMNSVFKRTTRRLAVTVLLALLAGRSTAETAGEVAIAVGDVTIVKGKEATVDILYSLTDGKKYVGFKFQVVLPEGLSLVEDPENKGYPWYDGTLSSIAKLNITPAANGSFAATPRTANGAISGGEGVLMRVRIKAAETVGEGTPLVARLTGLSLNHRDANYNVSKTTLPDVTFGVTVSQSDDVTLAAKSHVRQYGDENPAFEYEVTSGSIVSGTPALSCSATATSPVGDYDIDIAKGTVSNSTVNLVKGTLTVTKAPLTITAKSFSIKQGEPLPTYEMTYKGFKNGETKSVLTKQPSVSCAATAESEPGKYDIIVSGATADNYEITHVKGTLRIRSLIAELGDLNDDGEIDVTDVVELIDMVLAGIYDPAGDINGDGEVDVTDVVELIDMVLAGE